MTTKSIEEKVEDYYKNYLQQLGIVSYGKNQADKLDSSVADALATAPSKRGNRGHNFPDIMLMLNDTTTNRHIPVIIEVKGGKNKLEKLAADGSIVQTVTWQSDSKPNAKYPHHKGDPNNNAIVSYAVNGAYHYAQAVVNDSVYHEALFIGVNATELNDDNVPTNPEAKVYYLAKRNKMQPKHVADLDDNWCLMKTTNLPSLFKMLDKLTLSPAELEALTSKTEDKLERAVKNIHQHIYDNAALKNALTTNEKLYLFSGLIMAGLPTTGVKPLTPDMLQSNTTTTDNDGQTILTRITAFLNARQATADKVSMINSLLAPIFSKPVLWDNKNGVSLIKSIFTDVYDNILPLLTSDLQLDFTGKILNSLNDWVAIENDRQNDVVLTPRYVTQLMVKLTHTNRNSYVWDTAMGSGGFLVSAMNAMIADAKQHIHDKQQLQAKITSIKQQQLLGIEILGNIYILAVLNMILMGDGSSNMKNGNSHQLINQVADKFPANVFLLNPPYSAKGKGFNFVAEAFSKMQNGYGAVLIQENAGSGNGLPYTKEILKNNTLLASIHMPTDLFNGKSSVQTAIYVFKINEPHDPKRAVTFIDFSDDGYSRQNRKKSSQAVNLRDVDHATDRYQEVADIVIGNLPATQYYTTANGKLIQDTITLNGDDWTFNQHRIVDTTPTAADFQKTVADYLSWQVSQLLNGGK